MKKNAMLKIAAILMVAVLLTTCAISSTFAKYTTSAEDSTMARVAKFGYTVTVEADDAFATSYPDAAVISSNTDNLVAPGTDKADAITISIVTDGKSEVKTQVVLEDEEGAQNFIKLSGFTVEGNDYCPVVFTISKNGGAAEKFVMTTSVQDLQDDINGYIADAFSDAYAANTAVNESIVIGWSWDFVKTADGYAEQTNELDTKLGNAGDAEINFNFKATVEQVQPA